MGTIQDFLFSAVDGLRAGDFFDPNHSLELLEQAKQDLEDLVCQWEDSEELPGLEPLSEAYREALELFHEALELLEVAIIEQIPELEQVITQKTQDAIEVLRACKQQAILQKQMIEEEYGLKG